MIVPCLLLLGAGAYFSWRAARPLIVVFDEVQSLPLTPGDIANGFDAKFLIQTHVDGIPHSWWKAPAINPQYGTDLKFELIGTSPRGSRILFNETTSRGRCYGQSREPVDFVNGRSEFVRLFRMKGLAHQDERLDLKLAGRWRICHTVANNVYWTTDSKPLRFERTLTLNPTSAAAPALVTTKP